MKRFLGFAVAMFFALIAIALIGGDSGAVAGHGCHGRKSCHGKKHHERRERCHGRKNRCHGEAAPACESGCGEASACGGCADGGCADGGCAGGACGGEAVISEGVPTEVAPAAPAAT
jgi:hypothetical protein